ncbi:S-adenosyl-L-methionine-dependent methyltransferase [Sarocladium strictum]
MTGRGQRLTSSIQRISNSSPCKTTSGGHKPDVYRPKTLKSGVADCDCGSSIKEAWKLNCTYDALSAAWLPPWCRDHKLTSEFEHAGPGIDGAWSYFADENGKTELDENQVAELADSGGTFWVSREWHIAHCLFYWRKYIRMRDTGVIMEARYDEESHVKHCAGLIQNPTPDHFFLIEVPVRLNSTKIPKAGHAVEEKASRRSILKILIRGCRSPTPPQKLLSYLLDQSNPDHDLASLEHRQQLVSAWEIPSGSAILEIGCGQGDFTVVLADAVGSDGLVVSIDPSPLDWGTPPIVDAQAHLGVSPIGSRIQFLNVDPATYLTNRESTSPPFDFIVFGYCIWFFDRPNVLPDLLAAARPHARSVLISEFSFSTSLLEAVPHVLVAEYNAVFEAVAADSRSIWNVRYPLSPPQMQRAVEDAGWAMHSQQVVTPAKELLNGWREVGMLLREGRYRRELDEAQIEVGIKTVLLGMRHAVEAAVGRLDGGVKAVRNMDAWIARFD